MPHETNPAGSIDGEVISYVALKAFGFILGSDGERYFVHQKDVVGGEPLVSGQRVSFVPTPAPKGSKAKNVVPGVAPTKIFADPDNFVWSKGDAPRGMEMMVITGTGWGESNDPNEARELLIARAREWGANAVLNATMSKRTESATCSNYRYTVHRYSADFAIVKVVTTSSDPVAIAKSEHEMEMLREWWARRNEPQDERADQLATATRLIEPGKVKLMLGLTWSWTKTVLKIVWLSARFLLGKSVELVKARLAAGRNKG